MAKPTDSKQDEDPTKRGGDKVTASEAQNEDDHKDGEHKKDHEKTSTTSSLLVVEQSTGRPDSHATPADQEEATPLAALHQESGKPVAGVKDEAKIGDDAAVKAEDATNNKRKADDDEHGSPPAASGDVDVDGENNHIKRKRLCRHPGCTRVIKSQGHCQRHGAKAKRCKVDGCEKQAQGTHDGMCKRHWKAANFPEERKSSSPPEPEGESVYDSIIPMSIAYRPMQQKGGAADEAAAAAASAAAKHDLLDPPAAPEGFQVMPLVGHLKEGTVAGKPAGWHRNAERRARGLFPVKGLSAQLEPWERQLALMEILLLSGGTPYANFRELAHAWGREKGFHHVLANSVCERRGEVERKKRSDSGKMLSEEEKETFKKKLNEARDRNKTSKRAKDGSVASAEDGNTDTNLEETANDNNGDDGVGAEKEVEEVENEEKIGNKDKSAIAQV